MAVNTTGSNPYPRSRPFQPPQAIPGAVPAHSPSVSLAEALKRSWRGVLVGTAGAVLIVGSVAGIVYWNNRPGSVPATTGGPAVAKNDRMLETLGGLSATHLYQSYLNIGLVADAVENDTYTQAQASQMLFTVAGLMDVVDKQLERLTKMELSGDDKQNVQRIRAISSLMRVQIASLQAYWLTGDEKHAKRYHDTREKAWAGLSEVLGL
jgi:hypothetical protein